jgi:hypothetical protein
MNKETKNTTLPFMMVSDKTIIDILKQNGYVCVNETDTVCTFMNNGKLTFSDSIDNKKIVYSNKLCI